MLPNELQLGLHKVTVILSFLLYWWSGEGLFKSSKWNEKFVGCEIHISLAKKETLSVGFTFCRCLVMRPIGNKMLCEEKGQNSSVIRPQRPSKLLENYICSCSQA